MNKYFTKDSISNWILAILGVVSFFTALSPRKTNSPNIYSLGTVSHFTIPTDYWDRISMYKKHKGLFSLINQPEIRNDISRYSLDSVLNKLEQNKYNTDVNKKYYFEKLKADTIFSNEDNCYKTCFKIFIKNDGKKIHNLKIYFPQLFSYWYSDNPDVIYPVGRFSSDEKIAYSNSKIMPLGDLDQDYTKSIVIWSPVLPASDLLSGFKITHDEGIVPIEWTQAISFKPDTLHLSSLSFYAWVFTALVLGYFLSIFVTKIINFFKRIKVNKSE